MIQAQAQSKMISVEREAAIKDISTKAEASAILTLAASEAEAAVIRAEGDAQALELKGKAIKKVAEQFATDPVGQNIYVNILQADVAKHAKNLNLFFAPGESGNSTRLPVITLPLDSTSGNNTIGL